MLVSAVVHMVVLIALAFVMFDPKKAEMIAEVVASVMEEPDKQDELKVELENQLVEVTERTEQTFSTSMVVGSVGASGPQALVAAPTMDSALLEQAVNSDVSVEGIFIDVPSSKKLIVEAPDGQIGEARAVVDSYQEAMDRLTQEILWMLDKGPVLVVWAFDQSESMKDDQKEIRDRIEHVYNQLGLVTKSNENALETAVVSYGANYLVHTRKPTHVREDIQAAIDSVPLDTTGEEMMCTAVLQTIHDHRAYAARTGRQMALIVVTDESGNRIDNDTKVEMAVNEAKAGRCKIYVLGREAVFGYPYVYIRWIHPQTKNHHWIRIDRGPETAFVEQLQTDGFHRRYDAHPSGFGPYECTRLGRETGGIFFMLPSLETNLVHGQKRNYNMDCAVLPRPALASGSEGRDRFAPHAPDARERDLRPEPVQPRGCQDHRDADVVLARVEGLHPSDSSRAGQGHHLSAIPGEGRGDRRPDGPPAQGRSLAAVAGQLRSAVCPTRGLSGPHVRVRHLPGAIHRQAQDCAAEPAAELVALALGHPHPP